MKHIKSLSFALTVIFILLLAINLQLYVVSMTSVFAKSPQVALQTEAATSQPVKSLIQSTNPSAIGFG